MPVGWLIKMQNQLIEQMIAGAEPNKIVEAWILTDFGFENWERKEE